MPARTRGSITLELIIAFAIFSLALASVVLLESARAGSEDDSEELLLAQNALADLPAAADFWSIESTTTGAMIAGVRYDLGLSVADDSPCAKRVTTTAARDGESAAATSLSEEIADFAEARALGGDCFGTPSGAAWTTLRSVASLPLPANATALDILGRFAYLGLSAPPYFAIADVGEMASGTASLIALPGDFSIPAAPNDLDAVQIGDRRYVFAALATSTNQFAVIDVSDPGAARLAALHTLANVDPSGEEPEGYRVRYYGGLAYVSTRYTAGPELHVFDASDPAAPAEDGGGTELGVTLNDFIVRDESPGGKRKLYAVGQDKATLSIYDVTNPYAVSKITSTTLPDTGTHEGESLALSGETLIAGRTSTPSGADIFAYDARDLSAPTSEIDIGTGALQITVADGIALLATPKSGREFEVWDIRDPARASLIGYASVPKLAARGVDYESGFAYAAGSSLELFAGN